MNAEAVPQNDDEMAINQPNNRFVNRAFPLRRISIRRSTSGKVLK
jgi:hypothetical protein